MGGFPPAVGEWIDGKYATCVRERAEVLRDGHGALPEQTPRWPETSAGARVTIYRVIDSIDAALATLLGSALGPQVTVSFDQPAPEWPAPEWKGKGHPATLSCFLHSVAEDIDRRAADWTDERSADGRVAARRPPTRHYRSHYSVSAWAATAAEEHRLLGAVLEALLTVSELDVPGDNGGVATRVHVATSSVAGGIAEHQVWESLGVALRPSLALVVEFAMRPQAETDIATAAEKITIGMQHVDVPAAAAGAAAATGAAAAGAAAGSADSATRTWTAFRIRESH